MVCIVKFPSFKPGFSMKRESPLFAHMQEAHTAPHGKFRLVKTLHKKSSTDVLEFHIIGDFRSKEEASVAMPLVPERDVQYTVYDHYGSCRLLLV